MKILYIAHYKEGSGWSNSAINQILSINSTDIDVACRNIKLTQYQEKNINHKLIVLENKPLKDIDVCVQHVLPHHIVGTQKFKKNVAYFFGESNTVRYNRWKKYLSLVDEVWVPNEMLKNNLIKDGIKVVRKIPQAFNISDYENVGAGRINFQENQYKYKFYYIGEFNDRKNIESIIRCFYSEFSKNEQVCLVLKLKKFGVNPAALRNHITNICNQIKKELRIYSNLQDYCKEIIITEDFSHDQIKALHLSCDCFVSPTHGEGWSIPSFEAMCYGKTPICSNEGGPQEYIDPNNKNTGFLIDGVYDICNHSDPAFPDIFTGKELWFHPSEAQIKEAMRYYYENRNNIDRTAGLINANKFSYESVGKMIKDAINDK